MKITVAVVFIFALWTITSCDAKDLELEDTLKSHCAAFMAQTLTNVCNRRHGPALILVLDNIMQTGITEHRKIMDICCPSPCTADYMREVYCDYIKSTRSVNPSDALVNNPEKSTTKTITTASYTEQQATTTNRPWWRYLFSRNPGYQIQTVDPHWFHIRGAIIG